jgi:hypothetical protein
MSEFKFACPVCGQHITCDSTVGGSQMECPTCFRKIVVPHAPKHGNSKFVLSATEAGQRQKTGIGPGETQPVIRPNKFPAVAATFVIVLLSLVAGAVVFRDKLFTAASSTVPPAAPAELPTVPDTNWTLKLAEQSIPDAPVTGRINGRLFALSRTTVQGGTLTFRQGAQWPPDLGVTVHLFANQGGDLAGKTVNIEPTRTNAPRLTLRWKDEQGKAVNRTIRQGYALRVEFGAVKHGQLPGRIYLCVPDAPYSWVAGTFAAEIRKAQPAKAPQPTAPQH